MAINKQEVSILVVDDDKELADGLVDYLSGLGYFVAAAYSGQEGLKKFENGAFQLVITDLKMPDMDGMALLEAVKTQDNQAVVIVITGYGTVESAVKAIKKGAYDFINKPVEMQSLEVVINRALERHELSKQLSVFKGLTLALIISVPLWLILGILFALVWK
ncbi:MAG: response regulator [Deltaproteobacteria bacterium]|nr:response regulator [Deltaproteobacteria bacterium]MBW2020380.1 response regulator [Deltaproteobacteria bacterium]MBW2074690.1 response regulator [Deltaproteobacteria bacterium]